MARYYFFFKIKIEGNSSCCLIEHTYGSLFTTINWKHARSESQNSIKRGLYLNIDIDIDIDIDITSARQLA